MAPKRPRSAGAETQAVAPTAGPKANPQPLYAALDLGTNSCRMLIAKPVGAQFTVVDSFSKSVQLGAGLEKTGRLSRASMNRTLQALRICSQKLKRYGVPNMRLVATEACRRAENGSYLMRQVRKETGLKLEIIKAEEEAQLAVVSCAPLVDQQTEQLLVVDIGGGSTELVWIDLSKVPAAQRSHTIMCMHRGFTHPQNHELNGAKVVDWISVPFGVATLRDQFIDVEDDAGRFALMSLKFEEHLERFAPYDRDHVMDNFQIIGTSGTVTTVAASHLGLKRYDRNKVDGMSMSSAQVDVVSKATEHVNQNVTSVAAGAEEMAVSIKEIAVNSSEAARVTLEAVGKAQETTNKVSRLEAS
ncbi:MAG: hypothetical protein ACPGRD_02335, partial [Planktomarina sp.]